MIGNQSTAHFSAGNGGQNRLAAFSGVAGNDAVDVERRARPVPFCNGISALSDGICNAGGGEEFRFVNSQTSKAFLFSQLNVFDVGVEAREGYVIFIVMNSGDRLAQRVCRVGNRSAKGAGMEVFVGAFVNDFNVRQAAQPVTDGGTSRREHLGVADDDAVAGEQISVVANERVHRVAAAFFVAFENVLDVDRH